MTDINVAKFKKTNNLTDNSVAKLSNVKKATI